jgi:hypothetical protein
MGRGGSAGVVGGLGVPVDGAGDGTRLRGSIWRSVVGSPVAGSGVDG